MSNKIRIDDAGHFYLGEYDIGPFVVDHKILDHERVQVVLIGDVSVPHKKRVTRKKKKAVKDVG